MYKINQEGKYYVFINNSCKGLVMENILKL